jgi:hypothetical protein
MAIVDLLNASIEEEETLLKNVLCIILKFLELDQGSFTIRIDKFAAQSAESLMNCTAEDLQNINKKFVFPH